MQRIVLLLLGAASLVASGVIMDRGRVGLNTMSGLGLQTVQGINGGIGGGNVLTKHELLCQKFILDVLNQVYKPLQQQDLLMYNDLNIITNENQYVRPLTQEMVMVLDLINTNQMLGKHTICNISNKHHQQQIVGLYRLLVTARDFETFKHLVVYARQNINTEMFVNCLVLALGERQDTQKLIVPALHEILPQLFIKDHIIDQVQQLDTGVSSVRPQIMDVIGMGMGRRNALLNALTSDQQQGGLLGVLNRSQMWMPWRELNKQIAMRRTMGGNVVQQQQTQMDKIVISLPSNGLLSQDIELKSYVSILIGELLVNQDTVKKYNKNNIGYGNQGYGINENEFYGRRGQNNADDIMTGIRRNRADNDWNTYSQQQRGQRYNTVQEGINMIGGGRYGNGLDLDDELDMERNMYMGRYNRQGQGQGQEQQRGINTVSANDARLLFVGRRHKNLNGAVNMGNNYYNDDEWISGGRHVSNERSKNERQQNKYKYDNDNDNDDATYGDNTRTNYEQYSNSNRRGMMQDITNDNEENYWSNKNRGYGTNDYINRYSYGQGQGFGMGSGRGRNDFLNIITRGNVGQGQSLYDDDQDLMQNQGYTGQQYGDSLDMHLPTTSINDERLLHINRHKLYNNQEERYNNIAGGMGYEDNDYYNTGYQTAYQTGSTNKQHSRSRRSIVNHSLEQANTINGKLVLHCLQQLVARLNIERIALGQPQLIENTQQNFGRGLLTNNLLGRSGNQGVNVQTANEIENIIQQIDQVLQQNIGQYSGASYNQQVNQIGLMLAGQIQELGLVDILGEILQQTNQQQRKGQIANLLQNDAAQILLAGIVKVVDNKVQQVANNQREEIISSAHGININNVEVDQLQTYLEQTEIDLTNLVNNNNNYNIEQTLQGNNKVVVGRVPRLNHKSFNIKIDVTCDHPQQVVVRNLLVPKVDGNNNQLSLAEKRQNTIVLDITTVQLQQGRNNLKLKSNDITLTSASTTPLTKIYQLVMKALNGDIQMQQNYLVGQSALLPHHLLLPRGRTNGLPMQLITVITPLQGSSGNYGYHQGTGMNALLLDNLPLNYPLYCDNTDLNKVMSMPNVIVEDVKIYHEDNIQMSSSSYMY